MKQLKIGLNRCIKKIIDKLGKKPELILVDALKEIDTCGVPYQSIVKGMLPVIQFHVLQFWLKLLGID